MRVLQSLQHYDEILFLWFLQRRCHRWPVAASRWVSCTGDGYWYALLGVGVWWLDGDRGAAFLEAGLAAFLIERPLYFLLKNGFRRGRPQSRLAGFRSHVVPADEFSFPSGHTSAAFVTAVLLSWFYPPLSLPVFLWAAAVGLSRVLLGVHYPADVLAGAVMGTLCAWGGSAWVGG